MSRLKVNQILPFNGFTIYMGSSAVPEASALLSIQSTNQGVLLPSMTTAQRNAIASPRDGLLIYNTETHAHEHFNSANSLWESSDGVQSINGMNAKAQLLTIGSASVQPNWTQSGSNTNILNIPYARTNSVLGGLISKGEYDSFNIRQFPVKNTKYVVKNITLGPQDYNSIKDAVDSITDASISNPYIVEIGPGVFTEQQITMQPYVWIRGSEQNQTIITALNPNVPLIVAAPGTGISQCLINGVTGVGVGAVIFQHMSASDNTSFTIKDVRFGNNHTHCIADSTNSKCEIFIEEATFGGEYQFNTGFVARNGGRIVMHNTTTNSVATPVPTDVFLGTGFDSEVVLIGVKVRNGNATAGNCIRLRDGARLRGMSVIIKNWSKGILIENVGTGPFIDMVGVLCENNTMDLQADHPDSDGTFTGSADKNRISVNSNCDLSVVIACNANPSDNTGSVTVGNILQGDRYDRIANLSLIARKATTLGVIEDVNVNYLSNAGGLDVSVAAGKGFANDPTDLYLKEISWGNATLTLTANSNNYIFVDTNSTLQTSPSRPSLETTIILGRVNAGASTIRFIENSEMSMNHYGNKAESLLRNVFGPIFDSGCLITENAIARKLNTTAGGYFYGTNSLNVDAGTAIQWETFHKDGIGGFTSLGTQDTVSNTQYDDGSGTLVSIPAGNYARHHLYVLGDGGNEQWFLIYAQATYAALADALTAAIPTLPSFLNDAVVRVAGIIVRQGQANITSPTIDLRPRIGFAAPSGTAVTDHGSLTGLLDDDHVQYLLINGSRAMAGPLNMSTFNITNVGTVNGVTVETHASRHLPSGADPIATAAPASNLSAITSNSIGITNSLARSDHSHALTTGPASAQLPDQVNATGSSANLARADHIHNIPTAAPSANLSAITSNSQGIAATFSRSDHGHAISTGTPVTQTPDQVNATGSSANLARADHIHAIATAIAVDIGSANAQGSSSSFSRADHVHAHGTQAGGTTHSAVTTSVNGFMIAADKTKLDNVLPFTSLPVTAGSIVFVDAGGTALTQDNTNLFWDNTNKRLGLGLVTPQSKIHMDGGTATASFLQFTAGTTTGQTSADGFRIGVTATGLAQISQLEALNISFRTSNLQALLILASGSVALQNNTGTALATNATSGFLYISTSAGAPTGIPTTVNGTTPIHVDTTNNQFYFYSGGAWQTGVKSLNANGGTQRTGNLSLLNGLGTTVTDNGSGGFTFAVVPSTPVSISTSSTNTEGAAASVARSDHTHAVSVTNSTVSDTVDATTTSATDVVMTNMTLTPGAGTYLVIFGTSIVNNNNNSNNFVTIYVNAVAVTASERRITGLGANLNIPIATQGVVTVTAGQAIDIRWRTNLGTAVAHQRTLILVKLA